MRTAREEGVAVADVWTAFWEAVGKDERTLSEYLTDSLHLSEKDYEVRTSYRILGVSAEHPFVLSSPTVPSTNPSSSHTLGSTMRTSRSSSHGVQFSPFTPTGLLQLIW